jgi:hypothetical protein
LAFFITIYAASSGGMEIKMIDNKTLENREASFAEAGAVRYLEPGDFVLLKRDGCSLKLTLKGEDTVIRVKARRCFPYSFATKYISLCDETGKEIGMIRDLDQFNKQYRQWIEAELELGYFTPLVKSISAIKRRSGSLEWSIDTDRGFRKIITIGVRDTIVEVQPDRYILSDVDGNRYELRPKMLDGVSRSLLDKVI